MTHASVSYIVFVERTTAKTASKAPDVLHWLSKVTAIREHCLRLADVATSTTLSTFLLNKFEIKAVPNPVRQMSHSLDLQSLKSILLAAGCDVDEDPESAGEFMKMLAKPHSSSLEDSDNLGALSSHIMMTYAPSHPSDPLRMYSAFLPPRTILRSIHRRVKTFLWILQ
jgi:hypothetical protein